MRQSADVGEAGTLSEVDELRSALDESVAGLIDAIAGIPQADFEATHEGPPVRDLVWRAGLVIDWTRRAVDQGSSGREVDTFLDRERPGIAQTPEYLATWIEQCHRPMLALLSRLPDDVLDRELALATGESRTPRTILSLLADELHADAEHIRRWRAASGGE